MCVCVGGPGQGGHLQGVQAHDLRLHPRIQQEEPHGRPVRLLYILLFIYILVLSVSDPYSLNPDPAENLDNQSCFLTLPLIKISQLKDRML